MTPGERAVSNWFAHYVVRCRFAGADASQLFDMHEALVAIANAFTGSNDELGCALNEEAEKHYPKAFAEEWLRKPPPYSEIIAKARAAGCSV